MIELYLSLDRIFGSFSAQVVQNRNLNQAARNIRQEQVRENPLKVEILTLKRRDFSVQTNTHFQSGYNYLGFCFFSDEKSAKDSPKKKNVTPKKKEKGDDTQIKIVDSEDEVDLLEEHAEDEPVGQSPSSLFLEGL